MQKKPKPSFIRRNGIAIAVVTLVVIGGIWALSTFSGSTSTAPRANTFTMVQVALPPPPPPPPPPREEPKPRDDTPAQTNEATIPDPVAADEQEAPADESAADANDAMGTNVQSDGPADGFGLVGRGSGGVIGGSGIGGRGGSGSRWGRYEAPLKQTIQDAIRNNERTRAASIDLAIRIWPSKEGRIERVRLLGSTGNEELDRTLRDEVLTGLQLDAAPPPDMPLPITMRIVARRPN